MINTQGASQASGKGRDNAAFKGIRFCSECDNMLDAKEMQLDDRRYLQFECKLCTKY